MLTITLNPALDVCTSVVGLEPDRKLHCTDVTVGPGGGGVNVARVSVRLGLPATALALLSAESTPEFERLLAAEQVPLVAMPTTGAIRQSFTVVDRATCRQYRFVLPGPHVSREAFAAASATIVDRCATEPLVVLSGSVPHGVRGDDLGRLLAGLRRSVARVIVDVPGELLAAVAPIGATVVKPSVNELSCFAGRQLDSHPAVEAAARELLGCGPTDAVLVSLGAGGALCVRAGGSSVWLHAPRARVRSTVGAGDSLVAGVAVALQRGASMLDAARLGVAAGTAATLATGTGLAQPADIDRLVSQVVTSNLD